MRLRQKIATALLTVVMLALAVSAMTIILVQMRPLTPERISTPDIR
jgi:hypothetical protein